MTLSRLFAILALLSGCRAPDGVVDQCQSELALPPSVSTDILFVVDNSGSMMEEQKKVVDELHTFVEGLVNAPVHNDFQIGVVTTGLTQNFAQCGSSDPVCLDFPFEAGQLQRGKDDTGKVLDFTTPKILASSNPNFLGLAQQLIGQGVMGSGQEMGLEAARRAVSEPLLSRPPDGNPPGNLGFLRPGSRLLVIIVSDEDDCSDPRDCSSSASRLYIQGACGASCDTDAQCSGDGSYCLLVEPYTPAKGRKCTTNACESVAGRARLEPVSAYVDFFKNLDDGTGAGRRREVFLAVIGAVDATLKPARCHVADSEAYGIAARYKEAVDAMGPERALIDSICNTNYAATLDRIAALVNAPQSVDIPRPPLDPRFLLFEVTHSDGTSQTCKAGDGFDYDPPTGTALARATFKGACRLKQGDKLKMKVICAG